MECSTMCRVCMQTISLEYVDLDTPFQETTFFECFNYCTKLEAQASDKLPKSICVSCANLLQIAYDFIIAAAEADRLFQEYIAQLDENDDTKFKAKAENESKEIIMLPTLSIEVVSEIKPKIHHEGNENDESIENEELQVMQLARDTDNKGNVNLYTYTHPKDDSGFVDRFEIVESIEIEKVEKEDAIQWTKNPRKELKPTYRYILPKVETEPKEDPIKIEDILSFREDQISANVLTFKQESQTKTKCHICKKTIRKNFADHMNQHTGNRAYKCDKCNDSFFTLKQYRLHKAQNHKKFRDAWFCEKCGEAFESRTKLNTHNNNDHKNNSSGLCLTCGDILPDQDGLEQHVKDLHWSRRCPVECTHCKRKYQLNTLPMHVHYAHLDVIRSAADKVFSCKYCFKNYEKTSELEAHIKIHKGKHLYSCAICEKDFKGKGLFEEHKAVMHPTPNVNPNIKKCNKCDFTTSDLSLLVKHRKKHYNYNYKRVPTFLCAYCPKKFFNLKPLNDHEDYQHGEQKTAHHCELCGKKFYSKFKLQTHKKSAHENIRPFMCKVCPKAFKLKAQLLQHEKYHFERKIDCPHCDKKFVQPCYLKVHLRTHTNELPYECHLCDKKFAIKVRLTYHLAKHEGIIRQCEYCPETFDNMAKLRIHRFEHTGYPFVCDICKDNHHKRESFIRHMKRYHQIVMTESDVEENRLRNMKNFYRNPKVQDN